MSVKGGLDYIAQQQLGGGGFRSYRLNEPGVLRPKSYRTIFTPSLIMIALQDVKGAKNIRRKLAGFLVAQKSSAWSWNYWDRTSTLAHKMPYPDDLDDTFLALCALWGYSKTGFNPANIAHIANLLFATEQKVGGPYKTWLVNANANKSWQDIDVIVNTNVSRFLALQNVSLDNVRELIEEAIDNNSLASPYYPPGPCAAYLLSAWYKGSRCQQLGQQVMGMLQQEQRDPHAVALALTTLLRFGWPVGSLQNEANYLRTLQQADGSWPAGPMCVDTVRSGETSIYYTGSKALTTALCLEALCLYGRLSRQSRVAVLTSRPKASYQGSVMAALRKDITAIGGPELRLQTQKIFERITSTNMSNQIIQLPQITAAALGYSLNTELAVQLSKANIWGWMAYTVFDDTFDGEPDRQQLPAAIFSHRQLLITLSQVLPGNRAFHKDINAILDRIDYANLWELTYCRGVVVDGRLSIKQLPDYGDYWQLADRSLGHSIAGIGVLYGSNEQPRTGVLQEVNTFFSHYLIVRQLNDDAHDWEDDLRQGHINAVAVLLLKRWTRGAEWSGSISLNEHIGALSRIMWEEVIDTVARLMDEHLAKARTAAERAGFDEKVLAGLLEPLEQVASRVLATRDKAAEFMEAL